MKHPKMKMTMKIYNLLIVLFTVSASFSQNYKGTISVIEQDGLHKIMLTPEVRSASHDNFNFLRVNTFDKREVPYVLFYNTDKTFSTFSPIEIASKKVIKDSVSSFIIENIKGQKQDHITLQIVNTKVSKSYDVYGSDNGNDWFGLAANKRLTSINSPNKTTVEKTIYFPLNAYKFLRINFNDKNSLPINVLGAGTYKSKFFIQDAIEIEFFKQEVVFLKEKKVTQIRFTAPNTHKINAISFKVNTQFFLRDAKIVVEKTRKIKKRIETYNQVLTSFQLNSKNKNSFVFNNLNEKEFIIEIDNQDNPPLDIDNIALLQKPVYLVSNLKKEEAYKILIDSTLSKPSYDLGNFISNKTANIEEASISNFLKVKKEIVVSKGKIFWQTPLFMWICIALGGIIVVYFAIGLLRDIGNQEKNL
ncbi:hypothetical protein A8C32_15220 [Flavivirga aquatica]|uniref:DUF3999 domain-containing protein n=1 Tax=Flavivirga aquatica TaxID=1849968 RepID=A0A1E5T8X0_9FLAO|nr:hypothetical protein [Flavivirga aquatica]OEK07832.1 hypothetical protein A8C32_15220 [Flavivirga aquatica]